MQLLKYYQAQKLTEQKQLKENLEDPGWLCLSPYSRRFYQRKLLRPSLLKRLRWFLLGLFS